jgi:hypothetical protein
MQSAIEVSETDQHRAYWLSQGLAQQSLEEVTAADVLIVPLKDFRERIPFVFHQDTITVARFLEKTLAGQAKIEVLADDEEYLEIALHSEEFRFSPMLVSYVVAPLLVGLLTNYVYDVLKAKPGDSVEMSLIVEDQHCRAMKVSFKGDAKDFNLLADKVGELSRECMNVSPADTLDKGSHTPSSSTKNTSQSSANDPISSHPSSSVAAHKRSESNN